MKKLLAVLVLSALAALGQTTVYLKDGGPPAVPVCGATGNGVTPIILLTCASHGLSVGNIINVSGVATGTGISPANGIRTVIANAGNDSTHVALGDINGTAIAGTGAWFDGTNATPGNSIGGAQWIDKLTAYTLPTGPVGWLDGLNGAHTRELALTTLNGLTSVIVTGCPGACLATVTTSYTNTLQNTNQIGIWGSGNAALDNGNNPYTITRVDGNHFTFPAPGTTNGTKTGVNIACGPPVTPNDTIGTTQDCFVLSQWAFHGNPAWDGLETALVITHMNDTPDYKNAFYGGQVAVGFQPPGWYANAAEKFYVDRSNTQLFNAAMFNFVHPELLSNVNWVGNELQGSAGNQNTSDFLSHNMNGFAMVYSVMSPYAATATKTVTLNKLYNEVDDPTVSPCSRTDGDVGSGHNDILAAGLAQGGDSTHITLASADTAIDNFYVHNVVLGSFNQYNVITAYVASTKVATLANAWVAPAAGQAYTIYATVTTSSFTAGATATFTGYNTHFLSRLAVHDGVEGTNLWQGVVDYTTSGVQSIASDTSMTVINATGGGGTHSTDTTVPSIVWYYPQWKTGDCGMFQRGGYWVGTPGSQPSVYPTGGTEITANPGGPANVKTLSTDGGNNTATWASAHLVLDLATAADEPRAIRDLAKASSFGFSYELRHYMNYGCPTHSGTAYNYANTLRGVHQFAEQLQLIFPTFPDLDLAGGWIMDCSISKMFMVYPDHWYGSSGVGVAVGLRTGSDSDNNGAGPSYSGRFLVVTGVTLDPVFNFAPNSNNAKWFRNFLERTQNTKYSTWGYQGATDDYQYANVLHSDPRIASVDYTQQPTQYIFHQNSATRCASLTNWPCPATFRGDAAVSRGPWGSLSATLVYAGFRTFWGDHDTPQQGTIDIFKATELAFLDSNPAGVVFAADNTDETVIGNLMQFGGAKNTKGGIFTQQSATDGTLTAGMTPITRWSSGHAGSLGVNYGDQNSTYMHVCADLKGAYVLTTIDYAVRCVTHFKKPGSDEFIVQHDQHHVSVPMQLETHVHYTQNGGSGQVFTHDEGNTTCPGSGGCLSLNTNRRILSLEDGGTDTVTTRNYGLVTDFMSPGTITMRDDAAVNTVIVQSVRKTATISISSYVTGAVTTVNTATAHNLVSGEVVEFNSVTGSGCSGPGTGFNNGVFQWVITVTGSNQFTFGFDTRSGCTAPTGGSITTITMFNATSHGLTNFSTVRVVGATGSWAAWNQPNMLVVVVDANHFNEYWPSSLDTSAYGTSFDGTISRFYPGGAGYTHRVSICGGATCGGSASALEALVVHKIANGLTDTTLTSTLINPDANWTGTQSCGAVSCIVYVGIRTNTLQGTMTGFVTTHAGTAQYVFSGLVAGTYAVTIGGTPVTGSPFTVASGDSTIEFESASGTVSMNGSGLVITLDVAPTVLNFSCTTGGANPGSQFVTIGATGVVLDQWLSSKTQTFTSLNPIGTGAAATLTVSINCVGVSVGTHTDTITITSSTAGITNSPQTVAVNLTVNPAAVNAASEAIGGKNAVGGTIKH